MKQKKPSSTAKFIKPIIYLACKFSRGGKASEEERAENLLVADYWCHRLWTKGYGVIHPIKNTLSVENLVSYKEIIRADLSILSRCDAVFMCPDWEKSKGAKREWTLATMLGIPVMYWNDKCWK